MATAPSTCSAFSTTMNIGASARIGMVWEAMTQGITDRSIARLCTIPTASSIPSTVPMRNPRRVAESVIQPCQTRERLEVIFFSTVVFQISSAT